MHSFELKIDIHSNKDEVWDLLFNRFGSVNNFNPIIEGSHHTNGKEGEVGCERVCQIDSKTKITERISEATTGENFTIDIIGGGLPMMDTMQGKFFLKAKSNGATEVKAQVNFTTKPSFMAKFMKGAMKKMFFKMLIGLKYHLETNELVTKENIKSIIKEHKALGSVYKFPVAA